MRLNWIGPINNLGYGMTSLHIVDELVKLGHEVALFPIGNINCHFRHEDNIRLALANADRWDNNATCIRIWHQHDLSMFVGHGKHIGFPIFELDTFTEKEKHHLRSCDELFVCSNWARDIVIENITPHNPMLTKVVPLGVDNEIFTPKLSKRKPTVFLNVGKWEVRKGHFELIDAFARAFQHTDNVELWMMCDNPFLSQEEKQGWVDHYKNRPLGDKIRILPRVESDTQVAEIMQQADCGIFLSKAEGWNLEALEMLSCGKQVIATDYSAHTEFLTQENSWLVPIYGVEPAFDKVPWMPNGKWFLGQGNWAFTPYESYKKAVEYMQMIHERKQSGQLELNEAGIRTSQQFTWRNTAETIVNFL